MKRKHYILGTLALLCLLGTGYYVWTLYDAHRKQVVEWNEDAKAAFEEALWVEVNKRAEVPIYYSSSRKGGTTVLNESIPDTIFITSPLGRRSYHIEQTHYERSLVKESDQRAVLGALLYKYPLCLDTLAMHWDTNLANRKIPAQGLIRYVYTDWDLQKDTIYSGNESNLDSLTVSYLGFRCEHELVAFVSYPYWLFSLDNCYWVFLSWGIFILLVVFYTPLDVFFQHKFVKERIVEKAVHVADVTIDKAKIYRLPDGSWFNASECTLTKGDFIHTLPPQSSLLLKLFVRKENLYLSTAEIDRGLWNGNGTIDNIHKVIQRLRTELRKVSSELAIRNVNGGYELK